MVTFNIDGREFKAEEGQTILQVARENGIDIPTLCHHEALEPYGACRLCIVEVAKGMRTRIVTSCLYPAEEGLKVKTDSPRVISNRKMILELLLARCSKKPASPFLEPATDCIGCGSCYYICPTGAIKMEDRKDTRIIYNWKVEFKLKKCKVCGNYWAPEKQLEYIKKKWNLPEDFFDTCPTCK